MAVKRCDEDVAFELVWDDAATALSSIVYALPSLDRVCDYFASGMRVFASQSCI